MTDEIILIMLMHISILFLIDFFGLHNFYSESALTFFDTISSIYLYKKDRKK